eukprot:TRINITY_DN11826_c0_g1_i1.p1 TRINITY_DN11826_c0_g1~~TRINITY_DN11826_c0_g1_i1.p1  ORF type:complete len:445 (+),score=85.88 TRINITY_DN11826_c0_g1_i1:62-1396(+)
MVACPIERIVPAVRTWSRLGGIERGRRLLQIADAIRKNATKLTEMECKETRVPISQVRDFHIAASADCFEYFGMLAPTALTGTHMNLPHTGDAHSFGYCAREPFGICGGIFSWNYPLLMASWKAAAALACGNAIVLKPSPATPASALCYLEDFINSEELLPPGIFSVLHGGPEVANLICDNPHVSMVSFTGSIEVGQKVLSRCGIKKTVMELGGKSPLIIYKDACLKNAARAAMWANYSNNGQVCSNGTRVMVEKEALGEFLEHLIPMVEGLKVSDDHFDEETQISGLINSNHFENVLQIYQSGLKHDCEILAGGRAREVTNLFHPTVVRVENDDNPLITKELFAPVLSLQTFSSEEEVISRVNSTEYGLAAGVFTKDIQKAHRTASDLDAGTVFINNYNICPLEMPFGAFKKSGFGKECSTFALREYTRVKSVFVEGGDVAAM